MAKFTARIRRELDDHPLPEQSRAQKPDRPPFDYFFVLVIAGAVIAIAAILVS